MNNTFKINLKDNNENLIKHLGYKKNQFAAGELSIQLNINEIGKEKIDIIEIEGKVNTTDKIMELLLLKNAIDIEFNLLSYKTILKVGYIAYSRQDRVCNKGEAYSIKVMANIINSMNFDKVITYDNHSNVTTALINNCIDIQSSEILGTNLNDFINKIGFTPNLLCSPDMGASKKVSEIANNINIPIITATKERDRNNRNIVTTKILSEDFKGENILIIDDICDGGNTLISVAKGLKEKGAGEIAIYVTHGIFSEGTQKLFDNNIDYIITTNTFFNNINKNNQIKIIEL